MTSQSPGGLPNSRKAAGDPERDGEEEKNGRVIIPPEVEGPHGENIKEKSPAGEVEIQEDGVVNRKTTSYSSKAKEGLKSFEKAKFNSIWDKIYIDWKNKDNRNLKGFVPEREHYNKIFLATNICVEEIKRINEYKSGAGYIVITFKKPIDVIERFSSIRGCVELEEEVYFTIRGLSNLQKAQIPIDVKIEGGSEIDMQGLKEIMSEFGELMGEYEEIPHKLISTVMSGAFKQSFKPSRRLPAVFPVKGKKVEVACEFQILQCFKCLKFGHRRNSCKEDGRMSYKAYNSYFRREFGLSLRTESAQDLAEAQREELEEKNDSSAEYITQINPIQESVDPITGGAAVEAAGTELDRREEWKTILRKRNTTPRTTRETAATGRSKIKNKKRAFGSPQDDLGKKQREEDQASQADNSGEE